MSATRCPESSNAAATYASERGLEDGAECVGGCDERSTDQRDVSHGMPLCMLPDSVSLQKVDHVSSFGRGGHIASGQ